MTTPMRFFLTCVIALVFFFVVGFAVTVSEGDMHKATHERLLKAVVVALGLAATGAFAALVWRVWLP